jgi:hypothetical protein
MFEMGLGFFQVAQPEAREPEPYLGIQVTGTEPVRSVKVLNCGGQRIGPVCSPAFSQCSLSR